MKTIEIAFAFGDVKIDSAIVKPISFTIFAGLVKEAQALKDPKTFEGRLRRVRLMKQVEYMSSSKRQVLTAENITRMPLEVAKQIIKALDSFDESLPGKIANEGDGISNPIRYELGTPIEMMQGKDKVTISELEFQAQTYGDVEDMLAANDTLDQAVQLLNSIAKPIHPTLQSLPSWAIERITVADGVMIAQRVLPRFLE